MLKTYNKEEAKNSLFLSIKKWKKKIPKSTWKRTESYEIKSIHMNKNITVNKRKKKKEDGKTALNYTYQQTIYL